MTTRDPKLAELLRKFAEAVSYNVVGRRLAQQDEDNAEAAIHALMEFMGGFDHSNPEISRTLPQWGEPK